MEAWEQQILLNELIPGFEAAKKLQARLRQAPSSSPSSPFSSPAAETNETLMTQILSSYTKSLVLLNWSSSPSVQFVPTPVPVVLAENSGGFPESPASINGSPLSEEIVDGEGSSETHHRQDYIFNSKKRKMLPKWSEKVKVSPERGLEGPQDDMFSWRKYGQKDILGAKFPRSYYRCTHRGTQNCWATKQVQRSDSDATVFEVTYRGTHTCSQAITPASPEKKERTRSKTTIAQNPKDLLENFKTNLTVLTEGLDDANDVFSFPDTPPFYTYGTINGDFGHVENSPPIFDVVDWFNPTAEIEPSFPIFLQDSIYY